MRSCGEVEKRKWKLIHYCVLHDRKAVWCDGFDAA